MSDQSGEPQQQQEITITPTLESEPRYAEQLGHISVEWANLEWHTYLTFELVSGSPPAVARSIFYAIDSTRGRREMVSGIGKALIDNDSEKNILDDILRRIGKSSAQRNKYIHDTWGVATTQKHEVFQLRMNQNDSSQKMDAVTIPDMQTVAENIRKLTDELHNFRERIRPKVPAWLERYRKLPGLGLVYAPKGHPPGRKPKGFHTKP
ncbi:hypothetical protein IVB22_37435 [Bradyrhizobium sp. 190]|uniref:hypothetical protein n=1 Tax=Bradyrhizobium sp. 190 TaxID=2782658 RepID=UPI001FFAC1D8|nr:hypothetical protein [Bradyrhizobium sp. 190]MCK1518070.1 hypothetical protein [Bradyrhizobium sp. 190]